MASRSTSTRLVAHFSEYSASDPYPQNKLLTSFRYTIAHSASMPEGAIVTGWSIEQGESFGTLSWKNGLLACPVGDAEEGPWKVYGKLKGIKYSKDCLGFDALTTNSTKASAWQYT